MLFRSKVKLEGEAFFEVTKNADARFTVETEHVNIIVRGTEFNVSSYKEDCKVNISLLSGKIRLENREDNTFIADLIPNQLASISKSNMECVVTYCDAYIERLWTHNKLKFENSPAKEVFRKLERWYGVKMNIENADTSIYYGFTLKSESLREILHEINKITPITYTINGEEVDIKYK